MAIVILSVDTVARADTTDTAAYGSGSYGNCTYGSCTITLTGGGATNIDVTPTAAGVCTVQSDTLSVLTNNSAGYSLTVTTAASDTAMVGSSGSILSVGSTSASPQILTMNRWGYRVDNTDGFGSGPTAAQSSGSIPSVTFAGVPPNGDPGAQVSFSSSIANPAQNTTVWYGICADASVAADIYSIVVTYSAVTN